MDKKDSYLTELDEIEAGDGFEENQEATRVDIESEPPQNASEENLEEGPGEGVLELSADVPVQMVVVLGRKPMTAKDLLTLRPGKVVEMDKAPLEPVEIMANGKVIGKGELVNVNGKLGVRILKLTR